MDSTYLVPDLGTMAFTRKKTYRRKDGEVSTYYNRVENNWVDGQSRQKVLEYLGDSPIRREIRVDTSTAGELAKALFSQEPTPEEISGILAALGIRVDEEPRRVSLVYDPPSGSSLSWSSEPRRTLWPGLTRCPYCGRPPSVLKTRTRTVNTLEGGRTTLREVQTHCVDHPGRVHRSEDLMDMTPPGSAYGWDVVVHIGPRRFSEHRQVPEISNALMRSYGVDVP